MILINKFLKFFTELKERVIVLIQNPPPTPPRRGMLGVLIFCILFSCQKTEIGPQLTDKNQQIVSSKNRVLVLNEGTFNFSNASISVFDINSKTVQQNGFQSANNRVLGDVLHSAKVIGSNLYLIVNNSGKIEVVDTVNFKSQATITGFPSPRYICATTASKAHVSNFNSNNISVVNLATNTISGSINAGGRTEQLIFTNNKLYVAKYSGEILIINPQTDVIESTIKLSIGCQNLVQDANGFLWALCDGSYLGDPNQAKPVLYKIDVTTNKIAQQFEFNTRVDSPNKLTIDAAKQNLFWLNTHVFKMNISDTSLPPTPIIKSNSNNFYGLAIEPTTNNIYVADAIDFVQKGKAYIFTQSGSQLQSFETGIAPNGFLSFGKFN